MADAQTLARACSSILLLLIACQCAKAEVRVNEGAAGLARMLKRLQTTGSVLHVVAHPDDEDGALLTYCSRGLGVRTMLFSITRGEGGANMISSDFFDELGALRTLEHVKAASFYGNELFYSRATDYGYSKNLDEANRKWDNGKIILSDLTEVVRRERPTIILSRFRGDENDGHGHHQMAGVISQRVYDAAANREYPHSSHPTWQVSKLYTNNIRPQWRTEDAKLWTISIPTGTYDPLLAMSYAQLARYGLGFQRSQGITGHRSSAGAQNSYYRLAKAVFPIDRSARETDLFAGVDTSVASLSSWVAEPSEELRRNLQALQSASKEAMNRFDPTQLDACLEPLLRGLKATRRCLGEVTADQEASGALNQALMRKQSEFEEAIRLSTAMELEAWATGDTQFRQTTPGHQFDTQVRLVNRSTTPVFVRRVSLKVPDACQVTATDPVSEPLKYNDVVDWTIQTAVGAAARPTRQAWSRESINEPYYQIDRDQFLQRPLPRAPFVAEVDVLIDEVRVTLRQPVEVRFRDPELGQVRRVLTIAPSVSARFASDRGILAQGDEGYPLDVIVRSDFPSVAEGVVRLKLPNDWESEPAKHPYRLAKEGEEARYRFTIRPTNANADPKISVRAVVHFDGVDSSLGLQTITARDLGQLNLFKEALHHVELVDVIKPKVKRVGYIMGSGDTVHESLALLGVQPELLTEDALATGDLSQYDVILAGVRAYAVRPDLRKYNQRLLDYVEQGGVYIVQYQTPEFDNDFGPYPYKMGRRPEEVSEEDALVTLLQPKHRLFQTPNRITSVDFDDWVEQRGSKFLQSWDDRYVALLECHDTGQAAQQGGMVIAPYGEGQYVYTAYAWYRQLPQGVPGAFRIMANLLALGE